MTNSEANKKAFIQFMTRSEEHAHHGFQLLIDKKSTDFLNYFDDLKAAGLFDTSHNKEPVPSKAIPLLAALPFLKEVAKYAGEQNSIDTANKVLDIIRTVTNECINEKPEDNYRIWCVFAEILTSVPTEAVTLADIDFLPIWLNNDIYYHGLVGYSISNRLLPKWLSSANTDDWKKACRALKHALAVKWVMKKGLSSENEKPVSVLKDYWLRELLEKNVDALGQKCSNEAAKIFQEKLQEVYGRIEKKIPSWLIRPAIEDHIQNYERDSIENCLVEGLRRVLEIWLQNDSRQAKLFVGKLLNSTLEIERRLAIYLINVNFDNLKDLLSQAIPLLSNNGHLHEMYELLQSRFTNFDDTCKQQILDTIKNLPIPQKSSESIIRRQSTQRNWLSAIKGKGLPEADLLFYESNANPELGKMSPHPSFSSWMDTRWGSGPSPYKIPELVVFLDKGTLIAELNNFQDKGKHWLDTPTTEALVGALEEAVVKEPLKFTLALIDFQQAKRPYQYGVINGFKKLWDATNENEIGKEWTKTWDELLKFFENILFNQAFWDEAVNSHGDLTPNKAWIPLLIADFLSAGVKKDGKCLPCKFLPRVQKLLINLLEHLPSEWRINDNNAMIQAINTAKGKAIQALVDYTLFISRLSDREHKEHESAWKQVEYIFDAQLSQCNGHNQEFSTLIGSYAPNLEYLSYEWLENNIKRIFPAEHPDNFLCAIGGVAYATASKKLYILLRDSGIIQTALEQKIYSRLIRGMLLERIALAYLWGYETLNDERLQYIFKSGNEDDLYEIIKFFWGISEQQLTTDQKKYILAFWEESIAWAKRQKTPPGKLHSMMSLLLCYLEKVEEKQEQWLIASAPYVVTQNNTHFFLKELHRLVDENPKAVRNIFIALLGTYSPYYDFGDTLRSIITKLAQNGFKTEMLTIVNKLRGIDGFQSFYTELKSLPQK